jgi:hypothetical protein
MLDVNEEEGGAISEPRFRYDIRAVFLTFEDIGEMLLGEKLDRIAIQGLRKLREEKIKELSENVVSSSLKRRS